MLTTAPKPGNRYGRLVAERALEFRSCWRTLWVCQCDCGAQRIVADRDLRRGHTKSCGCSAKQNRRNFVIHVTARRTDEWLELLDVLESVLTRFPAPPREIRAAFLAQWGRCDERRFWRALRTLVAQGRAIKSGRTGTIEVAYTRSIPWRRNLGNCLADAAAAVAVYELGYRRAA